MRLLKAGMESNQEFLKNAWQARDILRRVGVTGKEALNCIVAVLVLRELERKFPRLADPATYAPRKMLMPTIREAIDTPRGRFSGIAAHDEHDGDNRDWSEVVRAAIRVLEHHPDTRETCHALHANADKLFPLRDSKTAMQLVKFVAQRLKLEASGGECLADLVITIVRGLLASKELGQFMTPAPVVEALTAICKQGRKAGHVYDPTCGVGSFLRALADAAESVTGTEIDPQVHPVAFTNMLLAASVPARIECANALTNAIPLAPDGGAFDTVITNPPFGVKGIYWEDAVAACPGGATVYPVRCATVTGLFLQRAIQATRVGGLCIVIVPRGREVNGRADIDVNLRRAITRACGMRGIIIFADGIFGVHVCALVMRKTEPLQAVVPLGNTQESVKVLQLSKDGHMQPVPGISVVVTISDATGWSFDPTDYMQSVAGVASVYPTAPLAEVCTLRTGAALAVKDISPGPYPVIGGGAKPKGFHCVSNTEALVTTISIIGSCGAVSRYDTKSFLTSAAVALEVCNPSLLCPDYLHWSLQTTLQPEFARRAIGVAQKRLRKDDVATISISLPPLEVQRQMARSANLLMRIAADHAAAADAARSQAHALFNASQ